MQRSTRLTFEWVGNDGKRPTLSLIVKYKKAAWKNGIVSRCSVSLIKLNTFNEFALSLEYNAMNCKEHLNVQMFVLFVND